MKIANLWVVVTSNNLGYIDGETDLYLSQQEAGRAASVFNADRTHDRADWLAIPLNEAIRNAIDDASTNAMAMDEG